MRVARTAADFHLPKISKLRCLITYKSAQHEAQMGNKIEDKRVL
jgi:hypothetical protein